jgi:REP-associated tyrosine transposase
MARPLRIEFNGAVYHATARGNARQDIFLDDQDRQLFLSLLEKVSSRFGLLIYAYCLMGNHYHLLLETPQANLSRSLRQLNGVYTQAFNRRHGRVGHVLQGRFKGILVDKDSYLLELARYVVLNPVRARMVKKPETYRWSSFRATAGLQAAPPFLQADWLLAQFAKPRAAGQRRYWQFVLEGIDQRSPWEQLQGQVLLGSPGFTELLGPLLKEKRRHREIPRQQRLVDRPALNRLLPRALLENREKRNLAIRAAHLEHGYSLTEIGAAVGLHYSSISKIVSRDDGETPRERDS